MARVSDETIAQNGAADAAANMQGEERASTSKIARVPHKFREQLNRRLRNGEPYSEILPWLNELPAVRKAMAAHFGGREVNHQNLSEWRHGGYEQWEAKQEALDKGRLLKEDAADWSKLAGGEMIRGTARMAAARIFEMLKDIQPGKTSPADLVKISYAIAALQNAEQGNDWLVHDETKMKICDERLTLQWDIHQRNVVRIVFKALNDEMAKKIHAAPYNNEEKFEMMGHCIWGESWQGREVGTKEGSPVDSPPGDKQL
jgi:hypothetical protein